MPNLQFTPTAQQWQIQAPAELPAEFEQAVRQMIPGQYGAEIAQLLWQRGVRTPQKLAGFLNPAQYQPTSPFAFGAEIQQAVTRLQQARQAGEAIAIWGDFDADGVTATAVLWEGLGQFFIPQKTLFYYIPHRFSEGHGLSETGIHQLQAQGCRLIVTCDTGSTNLAELELARSLGMDVIVTDHHTLPALRPPVTAIVNPRTLPRDHPLAQLSGVAVAYKLVEALYATLPEVPQKPLTELLDLVAIGLIADLVELQADCRYLAQRGIEQLQKQTQPDTRTRPGIAKLLELCKRTGDRPTDISFGLGPRINAVSRIQGDAHFCVELLTSQDTHLCTHLAEATELANARRQALQKDLLQQVRDRLSQLDLSTTRVIVLADEQWPPGVLGLVAGQIAQEYARPTILLNIAGATAQGSARSVNRIDLYDLVHAQAHLLERFGGHPYAAGLRLAVANLPLFTAAVNQHLRQINPAARVELAIDLTVTVAALGQDLFQALKRLEPYGMGNPVPRLLIQNCRFVGVWNKKIQDWQGRSVQYIKTDFELQDAATGDQFPGVWWGHYREDIPTGRCDAVVELDFNTYKKRYEVRLIAVRPAAAAADILSPSPLLILDWRGLDDCPTLTPPPLQVTRCPSSWAELQAWCRRAYQAQRSLAIAYAAPSLQPPQAIWQHLVGIAKYLSRTGQPATCTQLLEKLGIGDRALQLGIHTLSDLGFQITAVDNTFQVCWQPPAPASEPPSTPSPAAIARFFTAIREQQFRQQYFYQVPLSTLQAVAAQITFGEQSTAL